MTPDGHALRDACEPVRTTLINQHTFTSVPFAILHMPSTTPFTLHQDIAVGSPEPPHRGQERLAETTRSQKRYYIHKRAIIVNTPHTTLMTTQAAFARLRRRCETQFPSMPDRHLQPRRHRRERPEHHGQRRDDSAPQGLKLKPFRYTPIARSRRLVCVYINAVAHRTSPSLVVDPKTRPMLMHLFPKNPTCKHDRAPKHKK